MVSNRARDLTAPRHLAGAIHSRLGRITTIRTDVHIAASCFRAGAK
jgi:hypothetical protein